MINVAEELKRRGNCRAGLIGLPVTVAGESGSFVVRSTAWTAASRLRIAFEPNAENLDGAVAELCYLVEWPVSCCEPSPGVATPTHPLEVVAVALFRRSSLQDRTTLAVGMKMATHVHRDEDDPGIDPNLAYLTVAGDVLGCMLGQGKLRRDERGWYHLAGHLATAAEERAAST